MVESEREWVREGDQQREQQKPRAFWIDKSKLGSGVRRELLAEDLSFCRALQGLRALTARDASIEEVDQLINEALSEKRCLEVLEEYRGLGARIETLDKDVSMRDEVIQIQSQTITETKERLDDIENKLMGAVDFVDRHFPRSRDTSPSRT